MANFYGEESKYLVWNKLVGKYATISWLVVLTGSAIFVINNTNFKSQTIFGTMVTIAVVLPLLYFAYVQLKKDVWWEE